MSTDTTPTTYRLALVHALRLFGYRMVAAAVLAIVAAVLLTLGDGWAVAGIVVAVVVGLLVIVSIIGLRWPPRLITLDADGYRVRRVQGAGVRSAPWSKVVRVDDKPGEGGGTDVVIGLEGGATTRLPMALLGPRGIELQRDLRDRLNSSYGYRPLGEAPGDQA